MQLYAAGCSPNLYAASNRQEGANARRQKTALHKKAISPRMNTDGTDLQIKNGPTELS
jgi:hypothetical protein